MSKDTIYIDVEDDITSIIGKVKGAKSKIVALVPPKRVGVLQSAVNLRLLARAAEQSGKRIVLISGNPALTALAASANIPSARTLQSKPVLPDVPASADDGEEDVIDGADLPVGDHAGIKDSDLPKETPAIDSAIRASNAEQAAIAPPAPRPKAKSRGGSRVPNFNTFRKKLALGVSALVLLIGFLTWAIWFAPNAKIVITARTIESSANPKVTLATDATTSIENGFIKSVQKEIKEEASFEFEATGEKEVGEKSKGEVILRNCESPSPVTIERGTGVSAGGRTYITQASVTVPGGGGTIWTGCIPGESTPVSVLAQEIGEEYDMDSGTLCVAGHECSGSTALRATISSAIDGGSKKKVKVVTDDDFKKAVDEIAKQDISSIKSQLAEQFGDDQIAIDASFTTDTKGVKSSPAIDAEAEGGKASLTGSVLHTMIGVSKTEAELFLNDYFEDQIKDNKDQRVYGNGVDKTTFVDVVAIENGFTATMTATATFGPAIDDADVKAQARGKKFGEVQSAIEGISGVEAVDVQFSPFWVRTVPNNDERITIEFNLDESEE